MKTKRFVIPIFFGVVLSASGCASATTTYENDDGVEVTVQDNTDPQVGWVVVDDGFQNASIPYIAKRCDGTSLLYVSRGYKSGGIAVIENSPECAQ